MIEETGRVVAVKGAEVWIETIRNSSCSGCSARSGCGQGLLAKIKDGSRRHIRLHTELQLAVDDEVVLGLPEQAFIRSSFLAYGLPLLSLIGAVLIADKVLGLAEPWVIASAVSGLATGFLAVRLISQLGAIRSDFEPVVIKTIPAVAQHCAVDLA
ncbi:MAG: SoxR reducing system RseC family protein [Pseudomonadales bacterium]